MFGLDACSLMVSVYGVFLICTKKCGFSVNKREQNMLLRRNKADVLKITVWFVVIFVLNKVFLTISRTDAELMLLVFALPPI